MELRKRRAILCKSSLRCGLFATIPNAILNKKRSNWLLSLFNTVFINYPVFHYKYKILSRVCYNINIL
jgi:hypothetical protein